MTTPIKLEPGQTLWFVPERHYGKQHEVTVGKVGRKWAYVEKSRYDRIDVKTLSMYSGDSHTGKCYPSQADWETHRATQEIWTRFWTKVRDTWRVPTGVDTEKVRQAAEILGIELP